MKAKLFSTALCLPVLMLGQLAHAQAQTLAGSMDVFVFPNDDQESAQQAEDEQTCYDWAVDNSGIDPFELDDRDEATAEKAQEAHADAADAGQGSGARGAVRGAAKGALIGEVANDDASNGAAWGAAAGVVHGRRQGRRAQGAAHVEADAQADAELAATDEDRTNFKKAFSVCLEANDYSVKY